MLSRSLLVDGFDALMDAFVDRCESSLGANVTIQLKMLGRWQNEVMVLCHEGSCSDVFSTCHNANPQGSCWGGFCWHVTSRRDLKI